MCKDMILPELEELIKKLSLDDPMSVDEYLAIDGDEDEVEDSEKTNDRCIEEDAQESDEDDEITVLTHRQALNAVKQLSVYAALHGLDGRHIKEISDHCTRELYRGMKQMTIEGYFNSAS